MNIPNIGKGSGTSFSAPQVTGAVALIMCKYAKGTYTIEVYQSGELPYETENERYTIVHNIL